ncbi:MAG: hypothetical protein ABIV50_09440 [Opitutus sp.]
MTTLTLRSLRRRYHQSLGLFIAGLILAGLTAFPIAHELRMASAMLGIDDPSTYASYSGLRRWIGFADLSIRQTYAMFPSAGYGTDWLAFAHFAVAVFAIGPWRDPVKNGWVINCYLLTCIGVIPLALISGAIRDIPLFWRLIDCSFGVLGALPLLYCRRLEAQMAAPTHSASRDR